MLKRIPIIAATLTFASIAAAVAPNSGPGAVTTAPAKSWTVFGVELGRPPSMPVCKHTVLFDGHVSEYTYESDPKEICYEPDIQLRDASWRRGSINFPLSKTPTILSFNKCNSSIIDDKIEGLECSSLNYSVSDDIIQEIISKFGRPSSITRFTAMPAGIPVPATHVEWRLPNIYVSYRNIDRSVDHGSLLIETPIMQRARRMQELADRAARAKL